MADFKADIKTAQDDVNVRQRVEGQRLTGDMRFLRAVYTTGVTEVATDTVSFCDLPIGSYLIPWLTWVSTDGVGGTSVIFTSFGDSGDVARYATADLALTAAGGPLVLTPLNAILITPFAVTAAAKTLRGALAGTFPMTAGKKIVLNAVFRMP